MKRRRRLIYTLSPGQYRTIQAMANMLDPQSLRDSFLLRVADRLHRNGMGSVSDARVAHTIQHALEDLGYEP